jgi:hypothetical protein
MHSITAEQFLRLAETKQIHDVREKEGYLVGELADRFKLGRDPVWLFSTEFWLPRKDDPVMENEISKRAQAINPQYHSKTIQGDKSLPMAFWPGNWVIIVMLAWPMTVLGIPFWFVVGSNPFPTRSSSQRRVVPGQP